MVKTRTNSLTDMLSHGQFAVEKDAEVTHNIRGRDRIRPDMYTEVCVVYRALYSALNRGAP